MVLKQTLNRKRENGEGFSTDYCGYYVARMIEGCNAISVLILFVSFVFFSGKLKKDFDLYHWELLGLLFKCDTRNFMCVNVPFSGEGLLHGVLFPLFIYGIFSFVVNLG
jgi:hypothetical protein